MTRSNSTRPNHGRTRTLAGGIALCCATILTAGPHGPPELPSKSGIVVRNPADLPEEKKTNIFIGLEGAGGRSYDVNQDGRLDEGDLERMFSEMDSDEACGDLDGDGSVDGDDLAEMSVAIGFNRMLRGTLGFSW